MVDNHRRYHHHRETELGFEAVMEFLLWEYRPSVEPRHWELRPRDRVLSTCLRSWEHVPLTGLEPSLELLPRFGNPSWRVRLSDCLPSANIVLFSLINLLLISFCSCRRSPSYHQVGRPYSQTRPRLPHSVHLGAPISHFRFLNKQVQHP
jgi:hypothetical protein